MGFKRSTGFSNFVMNVIKTKPTETVSKPPVTANQILFEGKEDERLTLNYKLTKNQTLTIQPPATGGKLLFENSKKQLIDITKVSTFSFKDLSTGKLYFQPDSDKFGDVSQFNVTLKSGKTVQQLKTFIKLQEVNDAAVINGDTTGKTKEGDTQAVTGQLTIKDVDGATQEKFQVQQHTATQYGTFSLDESGKWSYQVDNQNPAVIALKDKETRYETITIKSVDGTSKNITITVEGINNIQTPQVVNGMLIIDLQSDFFKSGASYVGSDNITTAKIINGDENVKLDADFFARLSHIKNLVFADGSNYQVITSATTEVIRLDYSQVSGAYKTNSTINADNITVVQGSSHDEVNNYAKNTLIETSIDHYQSDDLCYTNAREKTPVTLKIIPDKPGVYTDFISMFNSSEQSGGLLEKVYDKIIFSGSVGGEGNHYELTLGPNFAGHDPSFFQAYAIGFVPDNEYINFDGSTLSQNDSLHIDALHFANNILFSKYSSSTKLMNITITGGAGDDAVALPNFSQAFTQTSIIHPALYKVSCHIDLGAGNDNFVLTDDKIMQKSADPFGKYTQNLTIDGGSGTDTLQIAGANRELDLSVIGKSFKNIETIDLGHDSQSPAEIGKSATNGDYTLTITLNGMLNMTDEHHQLTINGDGHDQVKLLAADNWQEKDMQTVNQHDYHVYTNTLNDGSTATLFIEKDIVIS